MSKIKNSLPENFSVLDGYEPSWTDPTEKMGDLIGEEHDCHLGFGEDGCEHPIHNESVEELDEPF